MSHFLHGLARLRRGPWEMVASVLIALGVLIGVAFGFVLERAGFGNARTLAGQWYGYNFAVLRVMFTAIVVTRTAYDLLLLNRNVQKLSV